MPIAPLDRKFYADLKNGVAFDDWGPWGREKKIKRQVHWNYEDLENQLFSSVFALRVQKKGESFTKA